MSSLFASTAHPLSRRQFERMVDAGVFGPEDRIELLNGEILDMAPQKSRHATAVTLVGDALRGIFGADVTIRSQLPFALDGRSEPEPDVAVVPGHARDYRDAHPAQALLICEVADTTLTYDRGRKLAAYAGAGIAEYWILDLNAERLEVYRQPRAGGYALASIKQADEPVAPIGHETPAILVRDLLP